MRRERARPDAVRVTSAAVYGVWAVIVATTPLHLLAYLPAGAFNPVGVMSLLPAEFWNVFIATLPLTVFRVLLVALLVTASIRGGRRFAIPTALGLLLFDGTLKSFIAYVDHTRLALLYTAVLLSLASKDSGDTREQRSGEPGRSPILVIAALLVATTYFLIGMHRLLVGGPGIFTGDAMPIYIMLRMFEPAFFRFELGYVTVGSALMIGLLKIGFLVTTLAEIASPIAVFHQRIRLLWLAVIIPFHVVTLLTMNIFFWENLILLMLLFTDLPSRIASRLPGPATVAAPALPPLQRSIR